MQLRQSISLDVIFTVLYGFTIVHTKSHKVSHKLIRTPNSVDFESLVSSLINTNF